MGAERTRTIDRTAKLAGRSIVVMYAAPAIAWASRLVVALVFTIGILATAGATRAAEAEADVSAERSEDCESVEELRTAAHATRTAQTRVLSATARQLQAPPSPRALSPRRPAPPRPSWLRVRRTGPPDDDDHQLR